MDKLYFEMSEAEKQLTLISNNVNYAICVFSEGLPHGVKGFGQHELRHLQDEISNLLIKAEEKIELLLNNSNL